VLTPLLAAVIAAPGPGSEDQAPIAIDPGPVEWFADEFFPRQIEELHIPGLTFVVVQHEEILLAKGCGLASREEGSPLTETMRIHQEPRRSLPPNAVTALFEGQGEARMVGSRARDSG
jgi:CubicO group peptidase (beta-lactamase class C family)